MRKKLRRFWLVATIKQKILLFTCVVMLIIFFSIFLAVWVVQFSILDFGAILEDNVKCSNFVQSLEEEAELLREYVKGNEETSREAELDDAIGRTYQALSELPLDYTETGELRYAFTWSILNCYEVYQNKRDSILINRPENPEYVRILYEVYDMQEILLVYGKDLMRETLESGSMEYQRKMSALIHVPMIVVVLGTLLLACMVALAMQMYRTIIMPVMELARASRRIAANDFFIDDVCVENKDELGELVHAYNKMKYATGQYILALEEKRNVLDLLHAKEVEQLEAEKRLEMIKFELLKNQIRPHFLFNTLNVIGGMANLEEAQTTEKMILALSSLFRYNLKTPEAEVLLVQELKVLKDYMYLQQMRFGGRISYSIACLVDAEKTMVPTFTFQPLVENAIIHGLSPKEEGGRIVVRIWQEGEILTITVADTGVGMTEEELDMLKKRLDGGAGSQIGISNVSHRIYALYPESSVAVFSTKGAGTVFVIKIPQTGGR